MKAIVSIIFLMTLFSTGANDSFGSLNESTNMDITESRVHTIVANSNEYRQSIQGGRSVAGFSQEDTKWAEEFESLMKDEREKDYLGMSLKL